MNKKIREHFKFQEKLFFICENDFVSLYDYWSNQKLYAESLWPSIMNLVKEFGDFYPINTKKRKTGKFN